MMDKLEITAFFDKNLLIGGMFVAVSATFMVPAYTLAAGLVWQTSKQAAVSLAQQQHRKILLVAGRDT